MATKTSCTSSLPWIWVIEALACFNEIDTSLLIDLVKKIPEMSDYTGRNAKEMVSLRVLENISNANDVASVPGAKIDLDPSKHCEDVLQHMLSKASTSDPKKAAPEFWNWYVRPFIMKKKSLMPNCLLQQLKDAIVDSTSPLPASLRKRSGLELGSHSRDSVAVDVGSDGFQQGHEVGGMNTQHAATTGNLDTLPLGNTKDLQENQPGSSLVPAKRSADATTAYEREITGSEVISENSSDPCAKAAKKFKLDVVSPSWTTNPDLMVSQRDGIPAESCGGSQPIVRKGNSEDEAEVGAFRTNKCLKDGSAEKSVPSSQGTKQSQAQQDKNEELSHNEKGRNSLNEVTEAAGSAPGDRNCVAARVMQRGSPQPQASVPERCLVARQQREEEELCDNKSRNKNSVDKAKEKGMNEVTEAGGAPADRNSVGAQFMRTGSPQPRASVPEQCLVVACQQREEKELCHNESRNRNSLEKAKKAVSGQADRNSMNAEVMQMHPPQPLVPRQLACQESSSIEESSEEEDGTDCRYCLRSRNPKDTLPVTHRSRRKKLQWTKMEEEKLRHGVKLFSHFPDKWKKILEFGYKVFQKGRTAVDLKDKWRNLNNAK